MRIAYVTPYQSPELLKRRPPAIENLGLAANLKIELVSELLQRRHTVEVFSQGFVAEGTGRRFYPEFQDPAPFSASIPVYFASAMPVRRLNAFWSSARMIQLLRRRHRASPFDIVIIYNLALPQVACSYYAQHRLGLPVVLQYEDDALVDLAGTAGSGRRGSWQRPLVRAVLDSAAACVAVSPHLLSSVSRPVPKLLLRGVVSENILKLTQDQSIARKKWVVFSGTHSKAKGLEPLLKAWAMLKLPDWELHIAGFGETTELLKSMSRNDPSVVFHGLLNREENGRLLRSSTIGINPHALSNTPGNVFAFKIIEYLAAGTHVITTPMGPLEPELEAGLTYMPDNDPETIADTLRKVIDERDYLRLATQTAQDLYGPEAVSQALDRLLAQASTPSLSRHE